MKRVNYHNKINNLVLFSILLALEIIITISIQLPIASGQGYINLSDCLIYLSGSLITPIFGGLLGGISGFFADIILGFAIYSPFTLIVKFFSGLICGLAFRISKKAFNNLSLSYLIAVILGTSIMLGGYFLSDTILFGKHMASINILFNIIQAGFALVITQVIFEQVKSIKLFKLKNSSVEACFSRKLSLRKK